MFNFRMNCEHVSHSSRKMRFLVLVWAFLLNFYITTAIANVENNQIEQNELLIANSTTERNESRDITTSSICSPAEMELCQLGCVKKSGAAHCLCYAGFHANGTSCDDINECLQKELNNCEKTCVNTIGSYTCTCPEGFRIDTDERSCTDINECFLRNGHGPCQDVCTNTEGSYVCSCDHLIGTQLGSDGNSCESLDSCAASACSHSCYNTANGPLCFCPEGYNLADDWKTCQDVDECQDVNCPHNCVNTPGSYYCACPSGYQPESSPTADTSPTWSCVDIDECLTTKPCSHICQNTPGAYNCSCPDGLYLDRSKVSCIVCGAGFYGNNETKECEDVNECLSGVCSDECINTEGSFQCQCSDGYTLGDDARSCMRGNCTYSEGSEKTPGNGSCLCPVGFGPNNNQTFCLDVDECIEEACSHSCTNIIGSFLCACPEGFILSEDNHTCEDVNECFIPEICLEFQVCVNSKGGYSCECQEGLILDPNIKECIQKNIDNDTTIVECPEGYQLLDENCTAIDDNNINEEYLDECGQLNCSHTCTFEEEDEEGTTLNYYCDCPDGLELDIDDRTCVEIDECLNNKCSHFCQIEDHFMFCTCPEGFELLDDQRTCSEWKNDTTLTRNCSVANGNCSHICESDEDGNISCECPEGFELSNDDVTCEQVDLCAVNNGNCSGVCNTINGTVVCSCNDGFHLHNSTCVDENSCEWNNGNCSHICYMDVGEVICDCPDGMELMDDGFTCWPECLGVRDADDQCVRLECDRYNGNCSDLCEIVNGTIECACPDGFILGYDGKTCESIKSCHTSNCSHFCQVLNNTISCYGPEKMVLINDSTCGCLCDLNNGGCSDRCMFDGLEVYCGCDDGYDLDEDEKTCVVMNRCEMDNGNCSHSCVVDFELEIHCECPEDHDLSEDNKTCVLNPCRINNGNCSHDCHVIDGGHFCACPPNFYRANDERTCLMNPCSISNGNCSHLCHFHDNGSSCGCPDSFELTDNGVDCKPVDPCQINNGGCSDVCTFDSKNGILCECVDGFELHDGTTCVEDPCRNCSHTCEVINKIAFCHCPRGYELKADQQTCVQIDFCSINNGNCSDICELTNGSWPFRVCKCPDALGYFMDANGVDCIFDPCAQANGGCSHYCSVEDGVMFCDCPEWYHLSDDLRTCTEINSCDRENGGCSHICAEQNDRITCKCPDGFQLENEKICKVINPCETLNGNCSHICNFYHGEKFCSCPGDMQLIDYVECHEKDLCRTKNCEHICNAGVCSCYPGYQLLDDGSCMELDLCEPNNGNCSDYCDYADGIISCSCDPEFELHVDNKTCVPVDRCALDNGNCSHICNYINGTITCSCSADFTLDGNTCIPINPCAIYNGNCSHICTHAHNRTFCSCPEYFELGRDGRTCMAINLCHLNNGRCSHYCSFKNGTVTCSCPYGYKLQEDLRSCVLVDPCAINNGGCSHICKNINGTKQCVCGIGFILDGNICVKDQTIPQRQTCSVNNGGCDHVCEERYTDRTSQGYFKELPSTDNSLVTCSCYEGYQLNGTKCVDKDECAFDNGLCAEKCVNTNGSYFCECKKGFQLDHTKKNCRRNCSLANGGCEQVCSSSGNVASRCECSDGYILNEDGQTCSLESRKIFPVCQSLPKPLFGKVTCNLRGAIARECVVECNDGYRLEGRSTVQCVGPNQWSHRPFCKPITCPRLPKPKHGKLIPSSCESQNKSPDEVCELYCESDLDGDVQPSLTLKCRSNLQWSIPNVRDLKTFCATVETRRNEQEMPQCPAYETTITLENTESSALLVPPQPAELSYSTIQQVEPSWANSKEAIRFPVGRTTITYTLLDRRTSKSTRCQVTVLVVDSTKPQVNFCPQNSTVTLSSFEKERRLRWQEPYFYDNVGVLMVRQTHHPGDIFRKGVHEVRYTAIDFSGNQAKCVFSIIVNASPIDYFDRIPSTRQILVCATYIKDLASSNNFGKIPRGCYIRYAKSNVP